MAGVQTKRKGNIPMSQTAEQTSTKNRLKQILALASFIARVLADIPFEQVQYLLTNKSTVLRKKLQEVFEIANDPFAEVRIEWQEFYKKYFGVIVDFSGVIIPPKPTGQYRLIFISLGLLLNATTVAMRKLFKVWVCNDDLDASVTVNTRTSVKSYAVWVRIGVEPDEKYLGKSTRDADTEGKIGVTLLERLVFEVKYFVETGLHLDIKGVTICTGSRDSRGSVPLVYFYPTGGAVEVYWCAVARSHPTIGLRQAVAV